MIHLQTWDNVGDVSDEIDDMFEPPNRDEIDDMPEPSNRDEE